jgi:hypothetical protein
MKLRINLEIDVSEMTQIELAAMVDRIRSAIDTPLRKRVVQMRLPTVWDQAAGRMHR